MPKALTLPLAAVPMAVRNFRRDADSDTGGASGTVSGKGAAARFEIVFTTGAAVRRFDWQNARWYLEELVVSREAVNLERLQRGAPLLNSHSAWSLSDQIGVVENPRIENGRGIVDATLSRRDDVAGIVQDLQDGIIRNVSVGYSRDALEMIAPTETNGTWRYRVTRWSPAEISLVPIPADTGAQVGAEKREQERTYPCEVTEINTRGTPAPQATGGSTVDEEEKRQLEAAAQLKERTRIAEIRTLCRGAQLSDTFAQRLIDDGASGETMRSQIVDAMIERENAAPTRSETRAATRSDALENNLRVQEGRPIITGGESAGRDLPHAIADEIQLRMGVPPKKPHPAARDVRGIPVPQLIRMLRSARGDRMSVLYGISNRSLVEEEMNIRAGMHGTSDFPSILGTSARRALRQLQESEQPSFRAWVKSSTGRDFKTMERVALGSAPPLQKINEGGEYEYDSFAEDKATFALAKYGRIFSISYEALTNDDLGAFDGMPAAMLRSANRLGSKLVYDTFTLNSGAGPTMPDGVALFHATHGNLSAGPVTFDSGALSTARVLLRKQQANAEGYLGLEPRFLLVSPEKETIAETLISSGALIKTATGEAQNPQWISRLELVVDPRLSSNAIYLLASPGQVDTYEYGELEGENGPIFETRSDFEIDQFSFKVRYVVGGAWIDYRGAVKVGVS